MSKEFEELKETLKKPVSKEAMAEAAEAFKRYRVVQLAKGKGSKPTLVNLSLGKKYPTAIPVDQIPTELERNPEFFELMGRIMKVK